MFAALVLEILGDVTVVEQPANGEIKILHVTEASGGGVLQVVTQLARHQQTSGAHVSIAMTERFDTPAQHELNSRIADCEVRLLGGGPMIKKLWTIFKFVRNALSISAVDVIHLHSSYAGLAGRLARMTVRGASPTVVYSAHAFGFLRTDVSRPMRLLIRFVESVLARFSDGTVAISDTEAEFARQIGSPQKVRLLANCLDLPELSKPDRERIVVANIGRLVAQKGPERFASAASRFANKAMFTWIGGRTSDTDDWSMGADVEVTGNLAHQLALQELSRASIHLFTSKWEGMPLALMESQAMGIPAIAWACPGISDVIIDGETGFIVHNEAEMLKRLSELLENQSLWEQMADGAKKARLRFSAVGYGQRSIETYHELVVQNSQRQHSSRELTLDAH